MKQNHLYVTKYSTLRLSLLSLTLLFEITKSEQVF